MRRLLDGGSGETRLNMDSHSTELHGPWHDEDPCLAASRAAGEAHALGRDGH